MGGTVGCTAPCTGIQVRAYGTLYREVPFHTSSSRTKATSGLSALYACVVRCRAPSAHRALACWHNSTQQRYRRADIWRQRQM